MVTWQILLHSILVQKVLNDAEGQVEKWKVSRSRDEKVSEENMVTDSKMNFLLPWVLLNSYGFAYRRYGLIRPTGLQRRRNWFLRPPWFENRFGPVRSIFQLVICTPLFLLENRFRFGFHPFIFILKVEIQFLLGTWSTTGSTAVPRFQDRFGSSKKILITSLLNHKLIICFRNNL